MSFSSPSELQLIVWGTSMSSEVEEQTLSRKERERLAHRREILAAAERVFATSGYHGATVEQIAQEADFAVGTLYNFFKSKHGLYEEVVTGIAEEFLAWFHEQVAGLSDPAEAIGAVIELRFATLERHERFARVFFATATEEHLEPGMGLPGRFAPMFEEMLAAVTRIFAQGVEDGTFVEADPLYLTLSLHGILNAFTAYWSRREPAEPFDERVAKLKALVMSYFRRRRN